MPAHVTKGDEVIVTAGRFRGKSGTIVRVLPEKERVVIRGPEIEGVVKTLSPTRENPQGGQVEVDRTVHVSNVSPAVDGKPTRVRFETGEDGSKRRVAARDGRVLSTVRGPKKKKGKS